MEWYKLSSVVKYIFDLILLVVAALTSVNEFPAMVGSRIRSALHALYYLKLIEIPAEFCLNFNETRSSPLRFINFIEYNLYIIPETIKTIRTNFNIHDRITEGTVIYQQTSIDGHLKVMGRDVLDLFDGIGRLLLVLTVLSDDYL